MDFMTLSPQAIKAQAIKELHDEAFAAAVVKEKAAMQAAKWWHKFVPFQISITRRK